MSDPQRIREIPYNYTSFSDREIVIRFLGEEMWGIINTLRQQRRTGRSARMLFEVLGDLWIVNRNPFVQEDLQQHPKRWNALTNALNHRLQQIEQRHDNNPLTIQLLDAAKQAVTTFKNWLPQQTIRQKAIFQKLSRYTRKDNICFDGHSRISHVTDATDWRVEYPLVILFPDREDELPDLVAECIALGLTLIPRGGGTGYTGGAIPLHTDTAVINTEKLETLGQPYPITLANGSQSHGIHAEAGVVTRRVSDIANQNGLVFAVDPTSQDASTIGGNVAMNAGGKKAVAWGTTIDNLLSWRMITPQANWLEIERINPTGHKIQADEIVEFRLQQYHRKNKQPLGEAEILRIPGHYFRQNGLGKDVTNKTLMGLPGMQKEGCDGLISSARFLLHTAHTHKITLCLEFFGNIHTAVPAIVEIRDCLNQYPEALLTGLEHLDARYLKAVNYSTKSAQTERPIMILLADISSDDPQQLTTIAEQIRQLGNQRGAETFIATDTASQQQFWQDRARTAAIAAHTNAFKINEDVVIPLDRLGDYSDEIETLNQHLSLQNKLDFIDHLQNYLTNLSENSSIPKELLTEKTASALSHLNIIQQRWQQLRQQINYSQEEKPSYRRDIEPLINELFNGDLMQDIRQHIGKIHQKSLEKRLFVALHMHAGDGNVHTNIPVHSNDYSMMQAADQVVDKIMALAIKLGGVISGEHGIGITKIRYLNEDTKNDFIRYKKRVDPYDYFNRGKLRSEADLRHAYTPSLRLLEQEALILEATSLGSLNDSIKHCLRCGKCKPLCNTHIPRANLLYSPRNKILSTSLIIEAVLYEEQTRRGISNSHFDALNDLSDHCTICHKCLPPCPVNIDFGDVSIQMRKLLRERRKKHFSIAGWLAMTFLNTTQPTLIRWMHKLMIHWSYQAQKSGHYLAKTFGLLRTDQTPPKSSTGLQRKTSQMVNFLQKPLPASAVKTPPMRALLNIENAQTIPILRHPNTAEDSEAVFYFPGCGSERLFSEISLATLAMLRQQPVQTILPPGYLCCGYPQTAGGDQAKGQQISTDNRVLFHRVANTLNYLDIKTVIVSCGTCMDQLLKYEFQRIFPGCRLLDIHEYLMEKGVSLNTNESHYIYHDPCHSPMKTYDPLEVSSTLMGSAVTLSDRCCGEAGTLAVNRPDISEQIRFRKQEVLLENISQKNKPAKLLTSCPSCQQGLSRYTPSTGLKPTYMVTELAEQTFGKQWQSEFIDTLKKHPMEHVLL
jgi:FAD/FMN-containing dehydrogenase/Fe-S oxidoreductase